MNVVGVYRILCLITGDSYIGSSYNIRDRWARHKRDLNNKKHHSPILQRAWNKYGSKSFIFGILEETDKNFLTELEQNYIDKYRPKYNICPLAESSRGRLEKESSNEKRRKWAKKNNIKPPFDTYGKKRKPVIMDYLVEFESLSKACEFVGRDCTYVSMITRAIKLQCKAYNHYWKWK